MNSIHFQIEQNKSKTWVIMTFFCIFIATVAYILGQASGLGISWAVNALVISSVLSLGSYFFGDKLVLAMSGAKEADKVKENRLFAIVERVAKKAVTPMPKIYITEDVSPNAFATGRDPSHAVVCATRGILDKLTDSELEGVIAHEISHVQNYDTRMMAIVAVLVGMIAYLSNWFMRMLWWGGSDSRRNDREDRGSLAAVFMLVGIILAILSPIIATIIQLAISRRREFLADASAALLTHKPDSLAMALEKISQDKSIMKSANNATAHLYISNPFKGKDNTNFFSSLFNTHPPIEERVKILRSM